ncbi:MAG: hypothetical protein ABII12_02985 [Planctomycetota bacterium]
MGPSDYVLLSLLDRLGGVQGRKKLQKLAYIAKLSGAPIEDDFFFHYYGPYSSGLASRVDQHVETKLLAETTRGLVMAEGVEYGYQLTDAARELLESVRLKVPEAFRKAMERGLDRAAVLKDHDVFQLELAATLLYWLEKGYSWEEAEETTERRKKANRGSEAFKEARKIAAEVWKSREQVGD